MPTGAHSVDEALRVVRALGQHRYVAARGHYVHAFVFASLSEATDVEDARRWAEGILADRDVDIASRDDRLWRRATDAELAAALAGFWTPGPAAERARASLQRWLKRAEIPLADAEPFDETVEEDIHPLLVDAGWELLSLAALDPERHRGAIGAFGAAIDFEVARFEEEEAIPPLLHVQELSGMGPVELLRGGDERGALATELVVWVEGNPTYHDYVVRGVRRAAKIDG